MASLFTGFLVEKYVALDDGMVRRLLKSEAILALLDSFQCISNGKPESLLYLIFDI